MAYSIENTYISYLGQKPEWISLADGLELIRSDLIGDNKTTHFLTALPKPGNRMDMSIMNDHLSRKKSGLRNFNVLLFLLRSAKLQLSRASRRPSI